MLFNIQTVLDIINSSQSIEDKFVINLKFNMDYSTFNNLIAFTNPTDVENRKVSNIFKSVIDKLNKINFNKMDKKLKETLRMTCINFK